MAFRREHGFRTVDDPDATSNGSSPTDQVVRNPDAIRYLKSAEGGKTYRVAAFTGIGSSTSAARPAAFANPEKVRLRESAMRKWTGDTPAAEGNSARTLERVSGERNVDLACSSCWIRAPRKNMAATS